MAKTWKTWDCMPFTKKDIIEKGKAPFGTTYAGCVECGEITQEYVIIDYRTVNGQIGTAQEYMHHKHIK